MALVLRLHTAIFDVTNNGQTPSIQSQASLFYCGSSNKLTGEDFHSRRRGLGWYSHVEWKGPKYLLGAGACDEEEDGQREWVLQIDKQSSVKEKLQGRAKMIQDDECAQYLRGLLEREISFWASQLIQNRNDLASQPAWVETGCHSSPESYGHRVGNSGRTRPSQKQSFGL
jgi:hypothetical protein